MQRRVVLITGASSPRGIGYATARRLAAGGHVVYATMRDLATAADLAADTGPGRIEVRRLDLLDRSAMRPLLDDIVGAEGRVDAAHRSKEWPITVRSIDMRRLDYPRELSALPQVRGAILADLDKA